MKIFHTDKEDNRGKQEDKESGEKLNSIFEGWPLCSKILFSRADHYVLEGWPLCSIKSPYQTGISQLLTLEFISLFILPNTLKYFKRRTAISCCGFFIDTQETSSYTWPVKKRVLIKYQKKNWWLYNKFIIIWLLQNFGMWNKTFYSIIYCITVHKMLRGDKMMILYNI